jgi:hypothetical protein
VLSWPVAVATGWLLGDKQNLIAVKSLWNGPFPITDSPGFTLLVLTLIPWALGVIMMLGYAQKKIGFWLCIVAAVAGGMYSFLLWFAFNAI